MSETSKDSISIAALFLMALLLHAGILDSGWRWDDPQILLHLHQYPISADFFDPQVWQQFSPANLTPWLILSLEIDFVLFGLTPLAFYLHQLLAMAAASAALFLCLRLWLRRDFALAAALLFLLGAPVAVLLEQLMTRHYVEGLLFCLLALYCFVRYLRGGAWALLPASVFFYLLSLTAKEIYAPLLVLLPFLPEASLRRRLPAVVPFALVALAYAAWRGWMLGSLSGGYVAGSDYMDAGILGDALVSFGRFPELLFGQLWPLLLLIYLGLLVATVRLAGARLLLSLLVLALVTLPLLPLVRTPGINSPDRYLFLVWTVLVVSLAFCTARLLPVLAGRRSRMAAWLTLPVFAAGAALQASAIGRPVEAVGMEFDTQAAFILNRTEAAAFMPSEHVLPSFWFVTGLAELKSRLFGASSPRAVVDPIYLQIDPQAGPLFIFERNCFCMRDISTSIPKLLSRHQEVLDMQAPLSLRYAYQDGYFSWEFGPYTEGNFHVVSDVIGVMPAPASGRLRVTLAEDAPFYLRYTAPEGWTTYSSRQQIQHNAPVTVSQRGRP